jgi:hypothetical protein
VAGFVVKPVVVDTFEVPGSWMAVASGLAELKICSRKGADGQALGMKFDFKGGRGFVVARKELPRPLSETWEFRFRIRGTVPENCFEFKIVDPSGANVWRWIEEPVKVGRRWREMVVSSNDIQFGWGPAGGGMPTAIGAIEFVISAGTGGAGQLWIDHFHWADTGPLEPAYCVASSGNPQALRTSSTRLAWLSAKDDEQPWVELDFGKSQRLGGMILHWCPGKARDVEVETLEDEIWKPVLQLKGVGRNVRSTPVPLHCNETRHIRLKFEKGAGLNRVEWKGPQFSHSEDEFLHAIAAAAPRGAFPKYWLRKQTLLTPVGSPLGGPRSMMNEEGMVETDVAGPSLEPFLHHNGRLWTWADAGLKQSLEKGWMPLPKVVWDCSSLSLEIAATPWTGEGERGTLVRYSVVNHSSTSHRARLDVAIRPFQTTPPWQHYRDLGGKSPIHNLDFQNDRCVINQSRVVLALDRPSHIGAQPFVADLLTNVLEKGIPADIGVTDPLGWAEGVFSFDLDLAPGETLVRRVLIPFKPSTDLTSKAAGSGPPPTRQWVEALGNVIFDVPPAWDDASRAWFTTAAHILTNKNGPALHPGPRRYDRAWIRDGVVMGGALVRAGATDAFVDFIKWYAPYLRKDGFVPCCVDENGPDWLIEHDSQGQWLYGISECHRFGAGDRFALDLWDSVMRCVAHTHDLRERRPDAGYDLPDKRPFRGLLPESASHEGYLAHPVHSYWDDFWAIRGLRDIGRLADRLERPRKDRMAIHGLADAFTESVSKSLRATMELRKIPYIPGSVEWADFDPSATAVAVMLLDGLGILPEDGLKDTFDRYLEGFRKKVSGETAWTNYSAYEMRIVSALVRLGRREDAHELLRFLLDDRRPREWNQWPEITWKDPHSPGHFGDLPHSWIGAEYVFGFASLFAYERPADETLVIAAGLPAEWFANGRDNGVTGLATYYGHLTYRLRIRGIKWQLELEPLASPPEGGIEVRLPEAPGISVLRVAGQDCAVPSTGIVRLSPLGRPLDA